MKCLTSQQSEEWLLPSGVRVDGNGNLRFPGEQEKIMTTMPIKASALVYLATRLASWVPNNVDHLLWLSNWETEPPEPLIQFEIMRLGCGEARHIIESPGHLFMQSGECEKAVLAGLLFLIMSFNWEGYVVPQNKQEYLFLGDQHIVFSSPDACKMNEVMDLVGAFHLSRIEDIRAAWT